MKKRHLLSLLALGISTACYGETYPAPIGPSQSDFGGVGLLQTPTARMAREGELSLNYRDNDQYRYYSASVQLFPWLETTLRYTDVRTRQYLLRRNISCAHWSVAIGFRWRRIITNAHRAHGAGRGAEPELSR